MKKSKPSSPPDLSRLIKICNQIEGAKAEALRKYNAQGGTSNWATFSSWMHFDPSQRREPRRRQYPALVRTQAYMVTKYGAR